MASEEQFCDGDGDFIALVSDDDFSEEEMIQNSGEEDPVEEDGDEEKGSDYEAPELDDFALYEIKTKHYHVVDATGRDYLKRGRVVDAASGGEIEQETPRKRMKVETQIEDDPGYGYYNDDEGEEEVDLWSCCPFVAESLELEHFSKHFLPDSGLSLVKRRLSDSAVFTNKVMDLEDQWKSLHKAEVELDLMRAQLIKAQTKLVLQAL